MPDNVYPSAPGFEYPSQAQERQLIEEAEHAKSAEVREALLNELANRRARFQVEYEQDRQRAIRTGREPLGNDPFDPRHGYDKFAEWLSRTYGTEQERNLDTRRFEYSTEGGDRYGRERDMIDQQRRLIELNEMGAKTGKLGMSKEEFARAKREAMEMVPDLPTARYRKSTKEAYDGWLRSSEGIGETGRLSEPWADDYGRGESIDPLEEIIRSVGKEEPKAPKRRDGLPLVPTRPGPKGSYFDFYVNPGDPRAQSEQEYDKLVNPKPTPSKGGKFVPIKGSEKPKGEPWRNATASQINDRLNQMPDDQATKIRTALGL